MLYSTVDLAQQFGLCMPWWGA